MHYFYTVETKIGTIRLGEEDGSISELLFKEDQSWEERPNSRHQETPLLLEASRQIVDYFNGERKDFDLPLAPKGTRFQQTVWAALRSIPYGETRSYKDIAIAIGKPRAYRAVGMANNRNPISIIIPCHRVIGSDGSLVGYGGGLHIKRDLLQLEQGLSERVL